MAEIPAPLPSDPEDIAWALETASALWKRGDREDALNWLRRASSIAREAGQEGRARELEVILTFLKPREVEIEVEVEPPVEEIAEIEELVEATPAAPKAPPRAPPRPPPLRNAFEPPPAPPRPDGPSPFAHSSGKKPEFADENTATEWPPLQFGDPPASAQTSAPSAPPPPIVEALPPVPELPSIEETVTEWPPKGAGAEFFAMFPPAPEQPSAPIPSAAESSSKLRVKPHPAPAPLDLDDDWMDAGPPATFRPPEPSPQGPTLTTLLQRKSGSLAPPPRDLKEPPPPARISPNLPPPQNPADTLSPPPTQKVSVPSALIEASVPKQTLLDELPAFSDIPPTQRRTFLENAKHKTLQPRDFVRGFALGVVLKGEALVTGFHSDIVVARLPTGSTLRARGTAGKTLPLRMVAGPEGCEVATWSEAPLSATFQGCPWVDLQLRAQANPVLGLVGVSSGLLGSLEPHTFEQLCAWLQPRLLTPGEIAIHDGETPPPLVVVGTGSIEIVRQGVVEKTLQAGDPVLPPECAQGIRATVQARAGVDGAVLMQVDKARRQAMQSSLPTVIALLMGL